MSTDANRGPEAHDIDVDVVVVGSGTGLAAALAAKEQGLDVLVIEKSDLVGGSTARSGGAFWIPANPVLMEEGSTDTLDLAHQYVEAVVGNSSPRVRWEAFLENGPEAVRMLQRNTPMTFFWAKGYSDYHPENPGGAAVGRTCEANPFDASILGDERARLRGGVMDAPVPMPVTGADYKWMNLMMKEPMKAFPTIFKRAAQGIGGKVIGREYMAGGQAIAAGLFAGAVEAGIPIWTRTKLTSIIKDGNEVRGITATQDGREVTINARRGVVLAAGGFDHNMEMRHEHQSPSLLNNASLGAASNTGDAITAAVEIGADTDLMDQTWWFPGVAPLEEGGQPQVLLAERSLPGSLMVNQHGKRFINEAIDYMTFGQDLLQKEQDGDPVTEMWIVFDQTYRNSYVFAGSVYPRMPLPKEWYEAGIAYSAKNPTELAQKIGLPVEAFEETMAKFNHEAGLGIDGEFHRGDSVYDRYYGDPTQKPNPNLRPVKGKLYAVKVALSDLGTCGGLKANEKGEVLQVDGQPISGLYAIGNSAANVFGNRYPGAGATIGQGIVYGHIVAKELAGLN